jgi:hypothetical protein
MADDKGSRKKMDKDSKDRYRDNSEENGLEEEEPNFSDPEDFVDKVTDEGIVLVCHFRGCRHDMIHTFFCSVPRHSTSSTVRSM